DGTAIEGNLGRGVPLAIGNEVGAGRIVVVDPGTGSLRHPPCQKNQPEHAAAVKRNVAHVLVGDVGAEGGILRVQQGRSRNDLDGSVDPQWVQFEINRGLLVHLQDDILFL